MKIKPILFLILGIVLIVLAYRGIGNKSEIDESRLKAAFLYVGPILDFGWTYNHHNAALEIDTMKNRVREVIEVENLKPGENARLALKQLSDTGCSFIAGTSSAFNEDILQIAGEYPHIQYLTYLGTETAPNVSRFYAELDKPFYLLGMTAGLNSENNKIGYIAPLDIPPVRELINAFVLGVQSVSPEAEVYLRFTGSWYSPEEERKAALALIEDDECSVIISETDSKEPFTAASDFKNVYTIGTKTNPKQFSPGSYLTGLEWNWNVIYEPIIGNVNSGKISGGKYFMGIEDGIVELIPFSSRVSDDTAEKVELKRKEFMTEDINIFKGPLYDIEGNLVVEEGSDLPDSLQNDMSFLLKGIVIRK